VLTFPEGERRESAVDVVVRQWAENDPNAAGAWLQRLPEGDTRTAALSSFIETVSINDPEIALTWANSIQDQDTRMAQFEIVAGNWMSIDEAAARAWITGSPLPKEVKERLLHHNDGTSPPIVTPLAP
jgi:hypothetical protein